MPDSIAFTRAPQVQQAVTQKIPTTMATHFSDEEPLCGGGAPGCVLCCRGRGCVTGVAPGGTTQPLCTGAAGGGGALGCGAGIGSPVFAEPLEGTTHAASVAGATAAGGWEGRG